MRDIYRMKVNVRLIYYNTVYSTHFLKHIYTNEIQNTRKYALVVYVVSFFRKIKDSNARKRLQSTPRILKEKWLLDNNIYAMWIDIQSTSSFVQHVSELIWNQGIWKRDKKTKTKKFVSFIRYGKIPFPCWIDSSLLGGERCSEKLTKVNNPTNKMRE